MSGAQGHARHTQTHTHTLLLAQRKIRLTGSKGCVGFPLFKGIGKKERKMKISIRREKRERREREYIIENSFSSFN